MGRSKSALCLKTATPVAATANAANRTATMLGVRVKPSKPGKERNVTDALSINAALKNEKAIEKKRFTPVQVTRKGRMLTIRQVHAPMMKIGAGPRKRPDSSSDEERPPRRARSRKKYGTPRQTKETKKSKKARRNGRCWCTRK